MSTVKRPKYIGIRLSNLEYAKLEAYAQEEEVTVSEAVRLLIQKLPKPQKRIDVDIWQLMTRSWAKFYNTHVISDRFDRFVLVVCKAWPVHNGKPFSCDAMAREPHSLPRLSQEIV